MANFTIKFYRYTPGTFDQWGWELQYPEPTGTEDDLSNTTLFPRSNVIFIAIRYIGTNADPSKRYGVNMGGTNFYYVNLFGAGVLDLVQYDQNVGSYRVGSTNGDRFLRVNAQVGGEVNRTADLVRVSTFDQTRVFTGRWTQDAIFEEANRRLMGIYPLPPEG